MPNEDTKVLERLHILVLDEAAANQLRTLQQAFIEDGDISKNVLKLFPESFNFFSGRLQSSILIGFSGVVLFSPL